MNAPVRTLIFGLVMLILVRMLIGDVYHGDKHGPDFGIYLAAADRLASGEPLYSAQPSNGFVYSPLLALALEPLAHWPVEEVKKLWWLGNACALVIAVGLYCWGAGWGLREQTLVIMALITAFRFRPTTMNFFWGQVNILLLACICGMLVCIRYQAWKTFGLLLTIGVLFKTWMIGFLLYPVLRRRWSAIASFGLSFVVSMGVLFGLVGAGELPEFLRVTASKATQPDLISDSWLGFARLHLAQNSIMPPLTDLPVLYYGFVGIGMLGFTAVMVVLWRLPDERDSEDRQLRWGLFTASLMLALPLAHLSYFVMYLPLVWAMISLVRSPWRWRGVAVTLGALVYLALTLRWRPVGSGYDGPPGSRTFVVHANLLAVLALYVGGCAAFWVHVGRSALRRSQDPCSDSSIDFTSMIDAAPPATPAET